ncbi:hypothetical protein [Moorena sp. SIO1G6]|nr:hypothetical protein [Moorena sp. SIO1G6]
MLAVSILLLRQVLYDRCSRIYLGLKYPAPGKLVDVGAKPWPIGTRVAFNQPVNLPYTERQRRTSK